MREEIKYFINDNRYFKLSIGQYYQIMATIHDEYNPTIIDAWFATDFSQAKNKDCNDILIDTTLSGFLIGEIGDTLYVQADNVVMRVLNKYRKFTGSTLT